MSENAAEGSLELGRYVTVLRRRWLVVSTGLLIGLLLAGGYLFLVPERTTATALVNVSVISSDPFNPQRSASGLIDAQTEVQFVRSSTVVTSVAGELGRGLTPSDVRDAIAVELAPDTTVLRISFTADSRQLAVRGADAVAVAYLDYRRELAVERVENIVAQLTERRSLLGDQLRAANQRFAQALPNSRAANQADSDRQLIQIELDSLLSQLNELTAIDTTAGTVLTGATETPLSVSPRRTLVMGGGALLGVLMGIVLAFVRNTLDRRVHDEYDVSGAGGGAVLARLRSNHGTIPASDADFDAIRSLRERVVSTLPDGHAVLAVADLNGTVPSDVAANLALSLIELGHDVNLVLAEHDPAIIDELVEPLGCTGWTLTSSHRRSESARYQGLTVTIPGINPAVTEPAAGYLSRLLVDESRATAFTILAIPPNASHSLRLAAARIGHSFILVARHLQSRIDRLAGLASDLSAVRGIIHGTVLVPRGRRLELARPTGGSGDSPARPWHRQGRHAVHPAPGGSTKVAASTVRIVEEGLDSDHPGVVPPHQHEDVR